MKRSRKADAAARTSPAKRSRQGSSPINTTDGIPPAEVGELTSARTLAKGHLLAIARFPLDALSSRWKVGKNRQVDESHISSLCQSFRDRGMGRLEPENFMKVTCSASAVTAMMARLRDKSPGLPGDPADASESIQDNSQAAPLPEPLDFRMWAEVTNEVAELLDGQHRLKAARQVLDQGGDNEKWWTCEIYNRGKHP